LVTNYREKGENYDQFLGADSMLLKDEHLGHLRLNYNGDNDEKNVINAFSKGDESYHDCDDINSDKTNNDDSNNSNNSNADVYKDDKSKNDLFTALNHFPHILVLAQWQYDLNLRRAGSLGMYVYMFIYINLHVNIYLSIHTYMYIYIYTYIYIYIYIYA
jgi:hypothetical protein